MWDQRIIIHVNCFAKRDHICQNICDLISEKTTVKTVLYTYSCYICITILYVCETVFWYVVTVVFSQMRSQMFWKMRSLFANYVTFSVNLILYYIVYVKHWRKETIQIKPNNHENIDSCTMPELTTLAQN